MQKKNEILLEKNGLNDPMLTRPFRVKRVQNETYDTYTLHLESANGKNDLEFQAGQFNMLYVYGIGEIPISISGDPSEPGVLVHTARAVGTVTNAMRKLRRGDMLGVRGPFGRGWPVDQLDGHDIVFLTGGIGLAPLRPAIYQVLSNREKYGKIILLYGAKTPSDLLYREELEQWRSRFDLDVYVTVDRGMGGWRGNVGVVTLLVQRAPFDPSHTISLVCGPEVMMRFSVLELQRHGVDLNNIYLSMERNMKCGIGQCGHCQMGHSFVCKDGPVYAYPEIKKLLEIREI